MIAITDDTGAVAAKFVYTPFGEVIERMIVQPVCEIPVGFVGQFGVLREPNGLYYMNARYYDSALGRFLSEDPAGLNGGDLTLYSYAANNPVVFVDPRGLCSQSGGVNPLYAAGAAVNVAGFYTIAKELSYVSSGSWQELNSKWNSLSWGGNQYTGARSLATSKAAAWSVTGKITFAGGAVLSGYSGVNAALSGNGAGVAKAGVDIGIGAFATFGGPVGLGTGILFFGLDMLGAWNGGPTYSGPPAPFAVPDATRTR